MRVTLLSPEPRVTQWNEIVLEEGEDDAKTFHFSALRLFENAKIQVESTDQAPPSE